MVSNAFETIGLLFWARWLRISIVSGLGRNRPWGGAVFDLPQVLDIAIFLVGAWLVSSSTSLFANV
jgi:hypothetical protein